MNVDQWHEAMSSSKTFLICLNLPGKFSVYNSTVRFALRLYAVLVKILRLEFKRQTEELRTKLPFGKRKLQNLKLSPYFLSFLFFFFLVLFSFFVILYDLGFDQDAEKCHGECLGSAAPSSQFLPHSWVSSAEVILHLVQVLRGDSDVMSVVQNSTHLNAAKK